MRQPTSSFPTQKTRSSLVEWFPVPPWEYQATSTREGNPFGTNLAFIAVSFLWSGDIIHVPWKTIRPFLQLRSENTGVSCQVSTLSAQLQGPWFPFLHPLPSSFIPDAPPGISLSSFPLIGVPHTYSSKTSFLLRTNFWEGIHSLTTLFLAILKDKHLGSFVPFYPVATRKKKPGYKDVPNMGWTQKFQNFDEFFQALSHTIILPRLLSPWPLFFLDLDNHTIALLPSLGQKLPGLHLWSQPFLWAWNLHIQL